MFVCFIIVCLVYNLLLYLQQMPSNVEIKARVSDVDNLLNNVLKFADTSVGTELFQEDTFFNVNRGRLKLRQFKVSTNQFCYCC